MAQEKELSKEQLKKRIQRAVVHVDRTKDTKEVYFADKGLRLIVTEDACVIQTMYHKHVFDAYSMQGISRPYLYTKRLAEMALENDCKTKDGDYSYQKLFEILKAKEDKAEFNIATYTDWWMFNIFQPLYSIGESEEESFLVYEHYLHNIARNAIILSEKTEDMTNKQFIDKLVSDIKAFSNEMTEQVVFHKKTDEEIEKENEEAMEELKNQDDIQE